MTALPTASAASASQPHSPAIDRYAPGAITMETLGDAEEGYRDALVRLMAIQAYGERLAATAGVEWLRDAPTWRERRVLAKILADEARHSALLYQELERIGVAEDEALDIARGIGGKPTAQPTMAGPEAVGDPQNDWTDICLNMMLLDRAGKFMIENYCASSYRPWARACTEILADEALHEGYGHAQFLTALNAGMDRDVLAAKVTRWFAYGLNFFGPPSRHHYDRLRGWGLKRKTNEELRDAYRQEVMALLARHDATGLVRFASDTYPWQ